MNDSDKLPLITIADSPSDPVAHFKSLAEKFYDQSPFKLPGERSIAPELYSDARETFYGAAQTIACHPEHPQIKAIREDDALAGDPEAKANALLKTGHIHQQYADYVTVWQVVRALEEDFPESGADSLSAGKLRERDFLCVSAIGLTFGHFADAVSITENWRNTRHHETGLDRAFDSLIHGIMLYRVGRTDSNKDVVIHQHDHLIYQAAQHLRDAASWFDTAQGESGNVKIGRYKAQAHYYLAKAYLKTQNPDNPRQKVAQKAATELRAALDAHDEADIEGIFSFERLSMEKDEALLLAEKAALSKDPAEKAVHLGKAKTRLVEIYTQQSRSIMEAGLGGSTRLVSTMIKKAQVEHALAGIAETESEKAAAWDGALLAARQARRDMIDSMGAVQSRFHNLSSVIDRLESTAIKHIQNLRLDQRKPA